MALIQCDFASSCLKRSVEFNIYIPGDRAMPGMGPGFPLKTLYLLHGYTGCCNDWFFDSELGALSELHGLAIVLPNAENHFYVDDTLRHDMYGEFIGHELVDFTRKIFPLSRKRDDTIIGGISMGGYGALRNGLKYHDVFGHIIGLSPAIIIHELAGATEAPNEVGASRAFYRGVFGDLDTATQRDVDLHWLAQKLRDEGAEFPEIYYCCGSNDMLVHASRRLHETFERLGVEHVFEEGPGTHEGPFFYPHLKRALDRLDLDRPPVMENPFWIDE